jgi:hypothetical protein
MAAPADHKKLKGDLASSREALTTYVGALRQDVDFGAKLKRAVQNNPFAWYAAAAMLGLLLSRIPPVARRRVVAVKKSRRDSPGEAGYAAVALTALKFALDFAKPALLRWFKDRYLGTRLSSQRKV